MPLIVISLSMFLFFAFQAYMYRLTWKQNLDVEVAFARDEVSEGENAAIIETVSNNKRTSVISLKVHLNLDKYLQFINQENTVLSDRSCHSEVFAMEGHSKVIREMKLFCPKRGFYRIDNVFLVSNDLFYTQRLIEKIPQDSALYVYPGAVDPAEFSIVAERILGQVISRKQLLEDPFEFRGVRQYEPFDPLRSINWKLSAKSGELRVNLYEDTADLEIRILLDTGCDMLIRQDALIEEAIRIASALAERFVEEGIITSLVSNGVDCISEIPFAVKGGAGEHHITGIKRGLARLKEGSQKTQIPMSQILQKEMLEIEKSGKNISYVLISSETDQLLVQEWNHICKDRELNWWIMPAYKREEISIPEPEKADVIYWRVPYGK